MVQKREVSSLMTVSKKLLSLVYQKMKSQTLPELE